MEVSHEMIAQLIGGTYALTLGSYVFTWVGLNRYDARLDKIRDNHIAHLRADIERLAKRMEQAEQRADRSETRANREANRLDELERTDPTDRP